MWFIVDGVFYRYTLDDSGYMVRRTRSVMRSISKEENLLTLRIDEVELNTASDEAFLPDATQKLIEEHLVAIYVDVDKEQALLEWSVTDGGFRRTVTNIKTEVTSSCDEIGKTAQFLLSEGHDGDKVTAALSAIFNLPHRCWHKIDFEKQTKLLLEMKKEHKKCRSKKSKDSRSSASKKQDTTTSQSQKARQKRRSQPGSKTNK